MNSGLVGLYALYLIFVGYRGNSTALFTDVSEDAKGFAPFVIAIIILASLKNSDTLKPFITPFIGLALLTFVLKNYTKVAVQVDEIAGTHLAGKNAP